MQEEPLIIQGPVVKYQRMDQQDFFLEKRKDWDPKEERREIQPRWPGVYEMEEDSVGSCAAL